MLLDAPDGNWCSLEVLDDVANQGEDGRTTVSQSKSALTDNPVADRAVSLWKTLFNWLELVRSGFVKPKDTKFELYVSRPVQGAFIDSFHESRTYEEAKAAVERVRNELWGAAPDFLKRAALSDSLSRYVNSVLEADDKLLLPIIVNLQLNAEAAARNRTSKPPFVVIQCLRLKSSTLLTKCAVGLSGRQISVWRKSCQLSSHEMNSIANTRRMSAGLIVTSF